MPHAVPELQEMTPEELDELFKRSPTGEIPDDEAKGIVLLAPGTNVAEWCRS